MFAVIKFPTHACQHIQRGDVTRVSKQVSQDELEVHDGVQPGKYTVGLGQRCMAFCGDQEDVVSMSLTAVHALLEKHDVDPKSIGRQAKSSLSAAALITYSLAFVRRCCKTLLWAEACALPWQAGGGDRERTGPQQVHQDLPDDALCGSWQQ